MLATYVDVFRSRAEDCCIPAKHPSSTIHRFEANGAIGSHGRLERVRAPGLRQNADVLQPLTERKEWKCFDALPKADPALAVAWWMALLLSGVLPAAFAIAM